MLSAADLLAGEAAVRDVEVPNGLLGGTAALDADRRVRLKSLTVGDLRLIARAAPIHRIACTQRMRLFRTPSTGTRRAFRGPREGDVAERTFPQRTCGPN